MFRDFRLLHGTAEAIPLAHVTQSMFVVYGHFGLDTICLFSFLVFTCWGLLWWLPFLRLLSFIHFPSFTLAPHSCGFFHFLFFSTSPIPLASLHCYTFAPFSGVSPSCTSLNFFCFYFYSAIPDCYTPYHFFILSTVTLVCPIPKPGCMILLPSSPGSNFTLQQRDWLFYLPENKSPPTPSCIQ